MDNLKDVVIDGENFQLQPLPAITALKLDKKVVSMLIPVLGGVDKFSLDAVIDMSKVTSSLSTSIANLPDDEFEQFVVSMLSTVLYAPSGSTPVQMDSNVINENFKGKLFIIYKLIWEVMGFNNFTPFVVLGGGSGIVQMFLSKGVEQTPETE